MRVENDNGSALIEEIEKKRGGKITSRTYSIFYADNEGRVIDNGVFIYKIKDTFWMEDFEKVPSIFGIRINNPKNYSYEKFERCFQANEIKSIGKALKKDAVAFAEHRIDKINSIGFIKALFGETITMLTLKDGSVIFLHLINDKIFKI